MTCTPVIIPMRSRSTLKIIGSKIAPAPLTVSNRSRHVFIVPMFGQSRVEGVPTGLTGGTPYAGPAVGVKTMSTASFAWVAYGLVDNQVYRDARASTVNFMTELARDYQKEYDGSDTLAEIRIINLAYSGSGRSYLSGSSANRWNEYLIRGDGTMDGAPEMINEPVLFDEAIEGAMTSDMSLYDAAEKAIQAGIQAVIDEGKVPILLCSVVESLVADMTTGVDAAEYYDTMQMFSELIDRTTGTTGAPLFTFKPRLENDAYPTEHVTTASEKLTEWVSENPHVTLLDPYDAIGYTNLDGVTMTEDDVFYTDGVHFTSGTYEKMINNIADVTYKAGVFGQQCRI